MKIIEQKINPQPVTIELLPDEATTIADFTSRIGGTRNHPLVLVLMKLSYMLQQGGYGNDYEERMELYAGFQPVTVK